MAYYRVSTQGQGRSGLGLEAQQEAIRGHLQRTAGQIAAEFVEVETGKGANALKRRPQLVRALEAAKKQKAVLIIAKLDRLARNVLFIATLMESGVDFICCDNPTATRLTLHILAAVAEHEREMISERTKAALAATRARGTVLGATGRARARENKLAAYDKLLPLAPKLAQLRQAGASLREMAEALNRQGVASPGGGRWHASNLHRAFARLGPIAAV